MQTLHKVSGSSEKSFQVIRSYDNYILRARLENQGYTNI